MLSNWYVSDNWLLYIGQKNIIEYVNAKTKK